VKVHKVLHEAVTVVKQPCPKMPMKVMKELSLGMSEVYNTQHPARRAPPPMPRPVKVK
jgi:hypothetical protein